MGSMRVEKPHAVCIPYPAQGHVNPLLKLAKVLHSRGFYITFVNTEFNHNRLLRSRGPNSLDGLDDFRFETIPDGLPPSDCDATQDVPALSDSTSKTCLVPLRHLVTKLNEAAHVPKVSCIVFDGIMSFALPLGEELDIPRVAFWTPSACGFMGYLHYQKLIEKGLVPLKDLTRDADFLRKLLSGSSGIGCWLGPTGMFMSNLPCPSFLGYHFSTLDQD